MDSPGIRWPEVVLAMLDAGQLDPETLTAAGLAAARRLSGADGAALVSWQTDRPATLAEDGAAIRLDRRPPEGPCVLGGRPLAVVTVHERVDLVVAREPGAARFDLDTFEGLRALAALVARGSDQPRKAIGAVYGVATKILGSLDLDEVLLAVVNAAAQLLRAEIAGIFLLDADGELLEMRCVVGHRSADTARLRIPKGKGLAGRVLETGKVMRVDDYATEPSITKDFVRLAKLEGAQSAISAPVTVLGGSIGVLNVWRRRRSVFTDGDVDLLVSLAHLAAVAVENARLYEAERTAAEQLRWAHLELEERYRATERALGIHGQLTQIAVAGSDVAAVVRTVSELTGGTVALLADDLGTLEGAAAGSDGGLLARVRAWLAGAPARPAGSSQVIEPDGAGGWAVVAPVRASGVQFGYLCLGLDEAPGPVDTTAAEQAATVCALLLAREEAALSAARRLQSEFVWDLLEGRIPDEAEALLRARHLGHGFKLPARVLLVSVEGLEQRARAERWSAEQLERARGAAARTLGERVQHASGARPVLAPQADLFAVIVPTPRGRRGLEPRELGRVAVERPLVDGLEQVAGVSGVVDTVGGLAPALRQARFALSTTRPAEPVAVFDDLGVLQFLLSPATRDDLDGFAERVLGPLLAYDAAHRTRLVESLEAYLTCDCHLQRSAERLYVHPKTMRYRLQRVQDLTGLALDTQEDRFNAQLALKILRVTAPPRPS